MSKKTYRIVVSGNDQEHWANRGSAYEFEEINKIPNPDGDRAVQQPTSIPSPFARMDLVKSAFKYLLNKKGDRAHSSFEELNGNTIYHSIVSECLDVAELFFNYDTLKNDIEIISWDSGIVIQNGELQVRESSDLGTIIKSRNKKHKLYGNTLKLFLSQDAAPYNFNALKKIYILNHKTGSQEMNVIGATSPSSLFLSSANDLLGINLQFNGHDLFRKDQPFPLFKRGKEFVVFMFALRASMPDFTNLFPEINQYMSDCFEFLPDDVKSITRGISNTYYNEHYDPIKIGDSEGEAVEILGFPLRTKRNYIPASEFEINSEKHQSDFPGNNMPLVLPNYRLSGDLWYWDSKWQEEFVAPNYDPSPLDQRTLPFKNYVKHPYLTVSDFLEPYLIKLAYPINSSQFFNGNLSYNANVPAETDADPQLAAKENSRDNQFLLPVSKTFFDYFDTDQLQGRSKDGTPVFEDGQRVFEMHVSRASVEVTLRIRIKSGSKPYITFKREYGYPGTRTQPDETANKGIIVANVFGASIYPFYKIKPGPAVVSNGAIIPAPVFNHHYRVMTVDRNITGNNMLQETSLSFYKNQKNKNLKIGLKDTINPNETYDGFKTVRSQKNIDKVTSNFYVLKDAFDYIQVGYASTKALIVPKFPSLENGTAVFKFAVDFGTSNTHIEYLVNQAPESVPFDITEKDIQLGSLHDTSKETIQSLKKIAAFYIHTLPEKEFLPEFIGGKSEFKFPQRSILGEQSNLDLSKPNFVLADLNIPFGYEKQTMMSRTVIKPNLKWSNHQMNLDDKRRVGAFIEELLLLIRNKIILNGGDIDVAELTWFFPTSMDSGRVSEFETAWATYYKDLINQKIPRKLSESIAPFYYFQKRLGKTSVEKPIAAIDIGGGTTDIVIFEKDVPILLTSFRFASNSIFGDGFNGSPKINGYVSRYYSQILKLLDNNSVDDLKGVMEEISKTQESENIISFFFSISSNKKITENKIPISFQELIKEDRQLRSLLLLFYMALIYHLARIMKAKGMEVPCDIIFTGTGSKIVNVVDLSIRLEKLKAINQYIFNDVYGIDNADIDITQPEFPKEITCKGGLLCDVVSDHKSIQTFILGDQSSTLLPKTDYKYSSVTQDVLNDIETEFNSFTKLFFKIIDDHDLEQDLVIDHAALSFLKERLPGKVMQDLKKGLALKIEELSNNNEKKVEETLFFYPLIGALSRLAFEMTQNGKK